MDEQERCLDENSKDYERYGGRGITVCERWNSFENFLEDMGECLSPGMQIERKDNDGDYEPNNCEWATVKEQANNRRSNVFYEHDGKRLTMKQWAEEVGIGYTTLHMRIKSGWSFARAITTRTRRYE